MWGVGKKGDLPDRFLVRNPRIRHIPIGRPAMWRDTARLRSLVRGLPGAQDASQSELDKCIQGLVDETEGLLFLDVSAVAQLARRKAVQFDRISDAVGVTGHVGSVERLGAGQVYAP